MASPQIPTEKATIGEKVPRRGNIVTRALGRAMLFLFRMRAVGEPPNTSHFMIIAAPHTSNWDGFHFVCCATALGVDAHWVGKHTLFKGIWGPVLRFLGGVAINRDSSKGFVEKVADEFREREALVIAIAPEGTRAATAGEWKSGFYRMAESANVPLCCGFIDYAKRRVGFGPSMMPTGDYEADLAKLHEFYRLVTPARPERYEL